MEGREDMWEKGRKNKKVGRGEDRKEGREAEGVRQGQSGALQLVRRRLEIGEGDNAVRVMVKGIVAFICGKFTCAPMSVNGESRAKSGLVAERGPWSKARDLERSIGQIIRCVQRF